MTAFDAHEALCRSFAGGDGTDGHPGDWDDEATETITDLRADGFIIVHESFVTSVLYSGSFETEDLAKLHAQAEALLNEGQS